MPINHLLIINTMPQTCSNLPHVVDALWNIHTLNKMYQFQEFDNEPTLAKVPSIVKGSPQNKLNLATYTIRAGRK